MSSDLARYLFLAGAVPYLLLGTLHAYHTPQRPTDRRGLSPADPDLSQAMTRTRMLLTPHTDLWLAWVGFNLSHSLGVVLFGLAVLLIGRSSSSFDSQAAVFLPFAVAVSGAYVALAVRYWFRIPLAGCLLSFACFVAAWALRAAG